MTLCVVDGGHCHCQPDEHCLCPPAERLIEALRRIAAIENKEMGGDWDEIDEARNIATEALKACRRRQDRSLPPDRVGAE